MYHSQRGGTYYEAFAIRVDEHHASEAIQTGDLLPVVVTVWLERNNGTTVSGEKMPAEPGEAGAVLQARDRCRNGG
jgi:hypothetical protein